MAKKKHSKQLSKTIPPKTIPAWLSVATFIALGILIFYPPFVRGFFFKEDVFLYHAFTAIVFTLLMAQKIYKKDYTLLRTPLDWAVLAYTGAYLLSLIGAVHPGEAFYGFLTVLNLMVVYWMVTELVKNYEDYKNILRILIAAGTGVAVIGILAATGYSSYPSAFDGRVIASTFQYTNATAAYLAVISLIAISLIITENRLITKLIYLTATFLMILVILCTLSKGAWLIFVVGAILLLIGMPRLYRLTSLYALGISFVAAVITYTKFQPAILVKGTALPYILIGIFIIIAGQLLWEGFIIIHKRINSRTALISMVLIALIAVGTGSFFFLGGNNLVTDDIANELSRFTNLEDSSYTARVDFIRWGIDIIKDYPINGAGAGGWDALYHQYQDYLAFTTEAHNHFIQVGVEAGLIGILAFVAIWITLILATYQTYSREKKQGNIKEQVLIWGTFTAAIALGVHAAMDFDLSLVSIALLLWVLVGLINAATHFNTNKNDNNKSLSMFTLGIAALCIIILFICGNSYYLAHKNATKASMALTAMNTASSPEEQDEYYREALKYYEKAASLDTNNAEYYSDLAYGYAIRYINLAEIEHEQTKQAYQETIATMDKAAKLKGNNLKVRNSLMNTATMLAEFDILLEQAEGSLNVNPNDIMAYELVARVLNAGLDYYQEVNNQERIHIIAKQIIELEKRLEKQKEKTNPDKDKYWRGRPLILDDEAKKTIAIAKTILNETIEKQ